MSQALFETIGDRQWVNENKNKIIDLFPETFTHISNINWLAIRFQLKLMGINYRTDEEVAKILAWCEKNKLLFKQGNLIKRNIHAY